MDNKPSINADRLVQRIMTLGAIGVNADGALTRLAGSDADKAGRDQLVAWIEDAGLVVDIDSVGNIFGTWSAPQANGAAPIMIGSHIDTVINAGMYDGCYGVLAGLEVAQSLRETGVALARPIVIAAFTNEEGVRFQPDMLGSLVHAGGISVEEALARTANDDGATLRAELQRIGYAGAMEPGSIKPRAYIELHIEQGPILAHEGVRIGAVETLQGISWRRIVIEGEANHAGTTPIKLRRDAGLAAARVVAFLRDYVDASNAPTVATVGSIAFEPNAINVIPSRATLTVDLRDPDEDRLKAAEAALDAFLVRLARQERVIFASEQLARFEPVIFDADIVAEIEGAARGRSLSVKRMTSGAGHDAQMMARIALAAMIFVPSKDGVSHNPREFTADEDLIAGANVLLDVVARLANE